MSYSERLSISKVENRAKITPYWGEHAARYVYARPYVQGKKVLDIACGTGYGCRILGEIAASIVGIDIDEDSIKKAMEEYPEGTFIVSNAEFIPFDDQSFDVITSFETIEHLSNRDRFILEIHRVLRAEGILILSTPNALYTKPVNGIPRNPFHVHEYTPEELRQELEPFFKIEAMLGQTLSAKFIIPPFWEAQQRLPKDIFTQARFFSGNYSTKCQLRLENQLVN